VTQLSKGDSTREAVLREALAQASRVGLRGITIGGLAEATQMSKSGLFAHFRSKEGLQAAVLDHATDAFVRLVIHPALKAPRGEPRLRMLFERWLGWDGFGEFALPGGCIFIAATTEFDDEPDGPLRDRIVRIQRDFLDTIETIIRTGVSEGHFRDDADSDQAAQAAQELYGIMLGHHFAARLMRDPAAAARAHTAFERLLDTLRA
jgi:AcrR family transcriptional regulator